MAEAIARIASLKRPTTFAKLKPVSTTRLMFDAWNGSFALFEDFLYSMLKMQREKTEAVKENHFYACLQNEALQTLRNVIATNKRIHEDVFIVFWRKYAQPESWATAKHKWHNLNFEPNTKSLSDFLEEGNKYPERALRDNAQQNIDCVLYAKWPAQLKRQNNLAYLKNGTYDLIAAHLESELNLSGLENYGEHRMPTMTLVNTRDNESKTDLSKNSRLCCKKLGHLIKDCRKWMRKEQEQKKYPRSNIKSSTPESYSPCTHC